ncbi:MAG: tetratricopeptide repeat protein [candidate division KSB1 bacterium]|nr:tetratricopeptide repeat protein [candidate division KSB1 bacterium]MDZ7274343.1 tetratricopeptide repeat protein [candidate division KSB1 bacterium]MDZ7284995.1 tetratricopeptide repeat protein [candidate division KSB1 bacterium]MDZ7297584.1 tetratricopeptide repeat protein [candidate division KSB1 bacterium]MDZ7308843.1 tetratricopeptide repeat protein [candidate division KSB1 bacterium]
MVLLLLPLALSFRLAAQNPQLNAARLNQAQTYEQFGQYERAAELYRSLFEGDPRNGGYYQGLRRCLLSLRRYEELSGVINRRLAIINDLHTRIDLGVVLYNQNQQAAARKYWNDLLESFPATGTYAAVAAAMKETRAFEEALQVYQSARRRFGQESLFAVELAELHLARLDYAAATAEYLRHLQADVRQFPFVQRRLIELVRESNEAAAQVEKTITAHLDQSANVLELRRLRAAILLENCRYAAALAEYQALEQHATAPAQAGTELFNFAEQARLAGAWEYAAQAYQLLLADRRKSPFGNPAALGLAECHEQLGQYRQALEVLQALITQQGANHRNQWVMRARWRQAEIYFTRLKDMPAAIDSYTKIYENTTDPNAKDRLEAIFRLGDCHLALGDLPQAKRWYETARRFGSNRPFVEDKVKFLLSRLEFYQGNFRAARNILEGIAAAPARSNEQESMVNDALELLLLIDANLADSSTALRRYARAEFLAATGKLGGAIDTLQVLLAAHPHALLVPQAMYNIARWQREAGQYLQAATTLQALLSEHGESVVADRALFHLAELHANQLNDYAQAQKLYEKLLESYPHSLYLEEARRRVRSLSDKLKPM